MDNRALSKIEEIENKYLCKYFYFLKYVEQEMLHGFRTKEKIKSDWEKYYDAKISGFAVGAERIVYALLNGKAIGEPNSAPVGSDLFFELEDAYIHIDMKTVECSNIGDYTSSIFVGKNQNSYSGEYFLDNGSIRYYKPSLPPFYSDGKICITMFVRILYKKENLDIVSIDLVCMPNGRLYEYYKGRPLKAGKIEEETRFHIAKCHEFELIQDKPSRIKVVYFNDTMLSEQQRRKLSFISSKYYSQ